MKFVFILVVNVVLVLSFEDENLAALEKAMDHDIDIDEDHFLEKFQLPTISDPVKKEQHAEALKKHQKMVQEANQAYLAGDQTWFDEINEFSDIPDDEFIASHTGMVDIKDSPPDEESDRFFDRYRYNRASLPASYDSVSLGHVSPVKNQGSCGSCVAFATLGVVETCFKKTVGVFGDYSEQHLLDCAYGKYGISGYNGASPIGYAEWLEVEKPALAEETSYPYKAKVETCPATFQEFNQGASVTTKYWTSNGGENLLKQLVVDHGAVLVGVAVNGAFQQYSGGIFSGCDSVTQNHAVVVVGYGTENGVNYYW